VTGTDVRAAAIDRALVADDPRPALALAGAIGTQSTTPLATALLAITCVGAETDRRLDEDAWRPGSDTTPLVVAGATIAVRTRDVSVEHAAELAGCAPATLRTAVERDRQKSE